TPLHRHRGGPGLRARPVPGRDGCGECAGVRNREVEVEKSRSREVEKSRSREVERSRSREVEKSRGNSGWQFTSRLLDFSTSRLRPRYPSLRPQRSEQASMSFLQPSRVSATCDECRTRFDPVKGGVCPACRRLLCGAHYYGSL